MMDIYTDMCVYVCVCVCFTSEKKIKILGSGEGLEY